MKQCALIMWLLHHYHYIEMIFKQITSLKAQLKVSLLPTNNLDQFQPLFYIAVGYPQQAPLRWKVAAVALHQGHCDRHNVYHTP